MLYTNCSNWQVRAHLIVLWYEIQAGNSKLQFIWLPMVGSSECSNNNLIKLWNTLHIYCVARDRARASWVQTRTHTRKHDFYARHVLRLQLLLLQLLYMCNNMPQQWGESCCKSVQRGVWVLTAAKVQRDRDRERDSAWLFDNVLALYAIACDK